MFRILFAGTPAIAVPSLRALAATGRVAGVLCAPDARSGRGQTEAACEVKLAALELGLPVLQPEKLDAAAREQVSALGADLLVCLAYGRIFGPKFLGLFPQGGINLHPSLLPKYRGPSPINAAIRAGDAETGITVQYLGLKMDAGDILLQERFALKGDETAQSLGDFCALKGADMLIETVAQLESASVVPKPQDDALATYCSLIAKDDGRIDWTRPAEEIERMVRSYTPWPRAWTQWKGQKLYIDQSSLVPPSCSAPSGALPGQVLQVDKAWGFLIQTGKGLLGVRQLQLQSKKSMDHNSFNNGARTFTGSVLGD